MKKEKEKIDLLIKQNENEQLSGFNWNQLQASISKRLDQADSDKTLMISRKRVFKIAAGIAAAAAVVFIAVMIKNDTSSEVKFENGGKGIVAFIENKGSAKVKIIEPKEQGNQGKGRSTWIIIRTSESKVADKGLNRDENDFACLM